MNNPAKRKDEIKVKLEYEPTPDGEERLLKVFELL